MCKLISLVSLFTLVFANVDVNIINKTGKDLIVKIGNDNGTGIPLEHYKDVWLSIPDDFADLIWATPAACVDYPKNCTFPVTSVGLSLRIFGNQDVYAVSVLEGYNFAVKIEPIGNPQCEVSSCRINLLQSCPEENQIIFDGEVTSCVGKPELFSQLCPRAISTPFSELVLCESSSAYRIVFS